MELLDASEIARVNGFHGLLENNRAVAVGEKIAVVEHVDPDLSIVKNLGCVRVFQHLARRHRGKDEPALFEVVLHGLPCEFEETFEALNDAFSFQRIERIGTVLHRAAQ